MHAVRGLISFLFEFIAAAATAAVVIAVVVAAVVALLELLIPVLAVVLVVAAVAVARIGDVAVALPRFVGPETLDIGSVGEFQLAIGDLGQLGLDGVIMDGLLMPVIVRQLHVVGDGIGKSGPFVGILFREGFVDDDLQVFAQMGQFGIPFGVF